MSLGTNLHKLLPLWNTLKRYPGGIWLFSKIIGFIVPYTGSMSARILHLEPGSCRLFLKDRRKIRNHLKSIHAIALANMGEATGGIALVVSLPKNGRAILVNLCTEYLKKARGHLTSQVNFSPPTLTEDMDIEIITEIFDQQNNLVAKTSATWRLGLSK